MKLSLGIVTISGVRYRRNK